jgi:hypothetical protein
MELAEDRSGTCRFVPKLSETFRFFPFCFRLRQGYGGRSARLRPPWADYAVASPSLRLRQTRGGLSRVAGRGGCDFASSQGVRFYNAWL